MEHKARGGPPEATIAIGGDLAAAVRGQQQHVRGRYGATATYLFPARNGAPAGDRPANPAAVGRTLGRWARACGMTASDGSPLALTPHRLRHTLATEMLNQGVSRRAIQDHLDHASPDMTAVYAKLLDSTLRAEFDAHVLFMRPQLRPHADGLAAGLGFMLEDLDEAARLSAEAVDLAERRADVVALSENLCGVGYIASLRGRPEADAILWEAEDLDPDAWGWRVIG